MTNKQFKELIKASPKPIIHIRTPYEMDGDQRKVMFDKYTEEGYLLILDENPNAESLEIVGIYSVWDNFLKSIRKHVMMMIPNNLTEYEIAKIIAKWKDSSDMPSFDFIEIHDHLNNYDRSPNN